MGKVPEHCGRESCPPCQTKEGSCKKKNIIYTIFCNTCHSLGKKAHYHGESNRTLWDRSSEHWDALRRKDEKNPLRKHWVEHHNTLDEPPSFSVKVVRSCRTATERQIRESLLISKGGEDILLNSKAEWGENSIPRQKTHYGEDTWEDNRKKEMQQTAAAPDRQTEETATDNFNDQYRQRKIRRQEAEKERQKQLAEHSKEEERRSRTVRERKFSSQTDELVLSQRTVETQNAPQRKRKATETGDVESYPETEKTYRNIRDMILKGP